MGRHPLIINGDLTNIACHGSWFLAVGPAVNWAPELLVSDPAVIVTSVERLACKFRQRGDEPMPDRS